MNFMLEIFYLHISCFELNQKVSNRYTITPSPSLGAIILVESVRNNVLKLMKILKK